MATTNQYHYTVYIKNYRKNAPEMDVEFKEKLFFTIPNTSNKDFPVIDPVINTEMGKAGSMEFSVEPPMESYDYWLQLKTIIRVEYGERTLFRGRVLTIDTDNITGSRKVHVEGEMSFLLDSLMEGKDKNKQSEESVLSYLQALLENHNKQMADTDKQINVGEVPGQYSSWVQQSQMVLRVKETKFRPTSWTSTSSALSTLTSKYGGFFTVRYVYDKNSKTGASYLDWFKACYADRKNTQPIELSVNVISSSQTTEVNNLFTVLIPIGKKSSSGKTFYLSDKYLPVDSVLRHYTENELNLGFHRYEDYKNAIYDYGYIYKTVQFYDHATTEEDLLRRAVDWIKDNYYGGIDSFDICALDQHVINMTTEPYFAGDIVELKFHPAGDKMNRPASLMRVVKSAKYYLFDPEKNSYKIGIPADLLQQRTDSNDSSSSSSSGSSTKTKTDGDGDDGDKTEEELQDEKDKSSNLFFKLAQYMFNGETEADMSDLDTKGYLTQQVSNLISNKYGLKLDKISGVLSMVGIPIGTSWNSDTPTEGTRSIVPSGEGTKGTRGESENSVVFTINRNGDIESDQMTYIRTHMLTAESNIALINSTLTTEMEELAAQGVTITSIGSQVTLIQSNLTDIERNMVLQGVSITSIGTDVLTVSSHLTQIEADLAVQGVTITKIGSDITLIHSDLTEIEADVAKAGVSITKIGSDVTLIHADMTELEGDLAKQGVSITKINSQVNLIGGTLNETEANLALLGKTITKISGDVVTINANLTDMEAELVSQGKTLTKISGDVIIIGGDLTEAQRKLVDQGLTITAINTDIVDIRGTLRAANAEITTIKSDYIQVNQLNGYLGRIFALAVDVVGANSLVVGNGSNKTYLTATSSNIGLNVPVTTSDTFTFGASGFQILAGTGTSASFKQSSKLFYESSVNTSNKTAIIKNVAGNEAMKFSISGNNLTISDGTNSINFSKAITGWSISWSGGIPTVTAQPQNASHSFPILYQGSQQGNAYTWDGNIATGKICYTPEGAGSTIEIPTGITFIVNAKERYDAGERSGYKTGWKAAANTCQQPGSNTSSGTMSVTIPGAVDDSTYYTFEVKQSKSYAYINRSDGVTVARIDNPQYSNGWNAAAGRCQQPGSNTSSGTMSVTIPGVVDDSTYYTFEVKQSKSYAYINRSDGVTVARIDNPQYANGWKAAANTCQQPGSNTSSGTMSVTIPGAVDNSTYYTYEVKASNDYAYISRNDGVTVARIDNPAKDNYSNGWKAAANTCKQPESNTSSGTMSVTIPGAVDDTTSYTFEVKQSKSYAYINRSDGVTVARIDNPQYSNGWKAAANTCQQPGSNTSSGTMSVTIPGAVDSTTSYTFEVKVSDSYAYISRSDGVTVARIDNTAAKKGKINGYSSWTWGTEETTASGAKKIQMTVTGDNVESDKSVNCYLAQDSAYNAEHKKNVYFRLGGNNEDKTHLTLVVDASKEYENGDGDGYYRGWHEGVASVSHTAQIKSGPTGPFDKLNDLKTNMGYSTVYHCSTDINGSGKYYGMEVKCNGGGSTRCYYFRA